MTAPGTLLTPSPSFSPPKIPFRSYSAQIRSRATEGVKSAKEGEAIEDKGKGKAEEGQDTYGEGGSSGRGGGRGEGKCRHGKPQGKCRTRPHRPRDEGEAAGGEGRGREVPETQRREKRARTKHPQTKMPAWPTQEPVCGLRKRLHLRAAEAQGSVTIFCFCKNK